MRLESCIFSAVILSACKFGSQISTIKESSVAESSTATVHGQRVSTARLQEILIAINGSGTGSPSASGSDQTMIALTKSASSETASTSSAGKGFALLADTAYMQRCRSNGVPIPPAWIDPSDSSKINPLWRKIAGLPSSRIFALDPRLETTLYAYTDANGTCAALPRGPKGSHATFVDALGMICQSKNGKSCFWDNKTPAIATDTNGDRFQEKIARITDIKPDLMADGDNLLENCSQCHRGDNIFIIHADTDMANLPNSIPDQKAEPLSSQTGWENPTGSVKIAATCQNGDCHNSLPAFNFAYCSTVLMPSLKSLRWEFNEATGQWSQIDIHQGKGAPMPPKDEVNVDDYANDIRQIETECQRIYTQAGATWVW